MHLPPHTSIIGFVRSQHYATDPAVSKAQMSERTLKVLFITVSKAQMSDPENLWIYWRYLCAFYRSVKSTNVRSILKICGFFGELCFLSQLFQLCLLHCLYRSEVGRKCNPCRSNQAISCVRATCTCTFLARVKNIRNVKNQTLLELPAPAPSLCGKHKKCQNQAISIANNSSLAFGLLDPCNKIQIIFSFWTFHCTLWNPTADNI